MTSSNPVDQYLSIAIDAVNAWLPGTGFSPAYIFGSLINKGGCHFDPATSDVDLIVRYSVSGHYSSRSGIAAEAATTTAALNSALQLGFSRPDASKPIVSIVPVSEVELDLGLHKGRVDDFFSTNKFLCLSTRTVGPIGPTYRRPGGRVHTAMTALADAQRIRNKFLAISPLDDCDLKEFSGNEALPKDLSRTAAQVRWAREPRAPDEDKVDLHLGSDYVSQLLASRRHDSPEMSKLYHRVGVRRAGKGIPEPLSPTDQLMIWEVLCDDATDLLPRSVKSK